MTPVVCNWLHILAESANFAELGDRDSWQNVHVLNVHAGTNACQMPVNGVWNGALEHNCAVLGQEQH